MILCCRPNWLPFSFSHAMHYSAKDGLVIACRLSVWWSVTLVDQDHIGWKSWKLIARAISQISSLFIAKGHLRTPRGTWRNFGETKGGWERVVCWSTQAAISLKCVKIEKSYYGGPIGSHQRSFEWYHSRPAMTSSSLDYGSQPPTKNSYHYYLRNG